VNESKIATSRLGLCGSPSRGARSVVTAAASLLAALLVAGSSRLPAQESATPVDMSFADARPILDVLPAGRLPPELGTLPSAARETAWPAWVRQHDMEIRSRLDRGDEDSIVNLLLFGVTFTSRTRLREADILRLAAAGRGEELLQSPLVQGRIDDLAAAMTSSADNERLEFARRVAERRAGKLGAGGGLRTFLSEITARVLRDYDAYSETQRRPDGSSADTRPAGQATLFRARGLASDTSIFPDFGVEKALGTMKASGVLHGPVRRVAIVGPGLDFTDRREGYDFYPQQTLQPFAILDTLIRLRLGSAAETETTTFDVSPRINGHLESARQRARERGSYTLQLPQNPDAGWVDELSAYWARFGSAVGAAIPGLTPPPGDGQPRVRAVRVRPEVVLKITPQDIDIVLQRLAPLNPGEHFDVILATNVLIYYDLFEQSLALKNIAGMLRPGGLFVTNGPVIEVPSTPLTFAGTLEVKYTTRVNGIDRLSWYSRN
jgi:hypothetical protein